MSIIKRGNSKFWYVQFQIDHQTVIRSTKTTDRKAAEQVAAKIRAEAHSQIVLGRRKPSTLADALDRFGKSKAATSNHKNIVSQIRIIQRTINSSILLSRIDQSMLDQFRLRRVAQGCGPQTIKHGINCIIGAVRLAKKHGFEFAELEPPSIRVPNTRLRYLSFEEERRLLRELDPKRQANGLSSYERRRPERVRLMQDNHDLVVLLLDTGARYSEIANIEWSRINLTEKSIRLWRPKVQNESILFMSDRVHQILSRRWKSRLSEFVFSSKSLGPRGYSAIAIRKAMRRAGLSDCTIHTLRHTHATRLIAQTFTDYVLTIWGTNGIYEYLLASDQRRHVWHCWLASKNGDFDRDASDILRFLTLSRSKDIILDGYGCCPPGLISALGRLGASARSKEFYAALFDVLNRGGPIAHQIHRMKALDERSTIILASIDQYVVSPTVLRALIRGPARIEALPELCWIVSRLADTVSNVETVISRTNNPAAALRKLVSQIPFPEPPFDHRDNRLQAVTSADQLWRIGRQFKNCLADRRLWLDIALDIQSGHTYHYLWNGERAALLSFSRFGSLGWTCIDFLGPSNTPPSDDTSREVMRVLKEVPEIAPFGRRMGVFHALNV